MVGQQINFSAVSTNPTHGKITWQGRVEGKQAEMTLGWAKERWYWNMSATELQKKLADQRSNISTTPFTANPLLFEQRQLPELARV